MLVGNRVNGLFSWILHGWTKTILSFIVHVVAIFRIGYVERRKWVALFWRFKHSFLRIGDKLHFNQIFAWMNVTWNNRMKLLDKNTYFSLCKIVFFFLEISPEIWRRAHLSWQYAMIVRKPLFAASVKLKTI